MEINFGSKNNTIHFNELEIGDCFKLPNSDNYFYLRTQDWRKDFNIKDNALSLNDLEYYNFLIDQEVIKVDATLTIYKD